MHPVTDISPDDFSAVFVISSKPARERSGSVNAFTFNSPFLSVQNHLVDFQLVIYVHCLIRLALHHENCCIHRMTDSFLHLSLSSELKRPSTWSARSQPCGFSPTPTLIRLKPCVPVIAMMLLIPL